MVTADKAFQGGGDFFPGAIRRAAAGHLVIQGTLGVGQDGVVMTSSLGIAKEKQAGNPCKRFRHKTYVRDSARIEEARKNKATGNAALIAGAIDFAGRIPVEPIRGGRGLVQIMGGCCHAA